jgi:hypothetical protein
MAIDKKTALLGKNHSWGNFVLTLFLKFILATR